MSAFLAPGKLVRLAERLTWYDLARTALNLGMFRGPIASALAAEPGECVLDVGCGTGIYAGLVPGTYVGVDPAEEKIRFARAWRHAPGRDFHVMTAAELLGSFPAKHFDKAMSINVLHHLPDRDCLELFAVLNQLVKGAIVIVDADLAASNRFQRFLLNLDPAHDLRSAARIEELAATALRVQRTRSFTSRSRSVSLCLLECSPS